VDISKESNLWEVPPMRPQKTHTEAFKKDAVRRLMARGSKTIEAIAKEMGVNESLLYRWKNQFSGNETDKPQASQKEREEIERLRRALRDVQAENTLLKKAAALFAKEVK
jgi:transposase